MHPIVTVIILLVAALNANAAALQTTGSAITLFNATNATHSLSGAEAHPCRNVDGGVPQCNCFLSRSETHGIDRAIAISTIVDACNKFSNGIGEPMAMYGFEFPYYFKNTYYVGNDRDNTIFVGLIIKNDPPNCNGPWPVSWQYCWDMLHWPLDHCDVDGENNKHGGVALGTDQCLYFIFDPNFYQHWPYENFVDGGMYSIVWDPPT